MEFKIVFCHSHYILFCSGLVWSGLRWLPGHMHLPIIVATNLMVDNGRCNAAVYTNIHHTYSLVRRFRTKIIVEENKKKKIMKKNTRTSETMGIFLSRARRHKRRKLSAADDDGNGGDGDDDDEDDDIMHARSECKWDDRWKQQTQITYEIIYFTTIRISNEKWGPFNASFYFLLQMLLYQLFDRLAFI